MAGIKVDYAGDQDFPTELTVDGVRGAGKVVLLLDGIRVSSPTNEPLPIMANYPVHAARQIEIVYGPASALYGADAFSAVVNIISRTPSERNEWAIDSSVGQYGLVNQSGSYATRFGADGTLLVAGQALYDRQPDLSRYYPADFAGIESLRTGVFGWIFGPVPATGTPVAAYENPTWSRSLQASLSTHGVQVTAYRGDVSTPTAPPGRPTDAVYNASAYQQNALFVLAGALTRTRGALTGTTTVTYSRQELDPASGYWNTFSNFVRSYKYAFGSMIKAEQQLTWRPSDRIEASAGGSVERYLSIPQTADLNQPVRDGDTAGTLLGTTLVESFHRVRYSNSAGYGQLHVHATPSLQLTIGSRADYNTRYGWTFNPRAGLVTRLGPATTLKLLAGTAYLAPSPYQAYAHYGSFVTADNGATYTSDYWHLPNPDLRPMTKRVVETELKQQLGPAMSVTASAFYARLSDLIQATGDGRNGPGTFLGWPVAYVDHAVNGGSSDAYGTTVELAFLRSNGLRRRLEGRAALAFVDGRTWGDPTGQPQTQLGGMVPLQFRGLLDIDWGQWSVAPRVAAFSRQRVFQAVGTGRNARRETLPGYAVVDLSVRRHRLLRGLGLYLTLENLLDARYRSINVRAFSNPEEFTGMPQNPRRATIGVFIAGRSR
jgi:outer membrane cobalamin receptor